MTNSVIKNNTLIDAIDNIEKLSSLLYLISHALINDNAERDDVNTCVSIAWDISYEIKQALKEATSA